MDHLSKEKRSWNMSRIRSRDTGPEITFRRLIHRAGFRYRLYVKDLPGKPDLVLKKYKTVVFIHGCFWHQHENCKKANRPKSNSGYWDEKLNRNAARDIENTLKLENEGWHILTIWECELKDLESVLKKFLAFIAAVGEWHDGAVEDTASSDGSRTVPL
jgi:DNA mismatch endonuclease (patch repair protein)